jgi:hypothetical protein
MNVSEILLCVLPRPSGLMPEAMIGQPALLRELGQPVPGTADSATVTLLHSCTPAAT